MTSSNRNGLIAALITIGALTTAGCTESRLRMDPDFGSALRQDLAAQVAYPDGVPAAPPMTSGARTALAQHRYEQNQVIAPETTGASGKSTGYGANGVEPGAALTSAPGS